MVKIILIVILALAASAASDPYVFSAPIYSAAYTAPVIAAAVPSGPIATVPSISAAYPFSSMSAYSFGSGYNVQDVSFVGPAAAPLLYSATYPNALPYAYAADYFYRK